MSIDLFYSNIYFYCLSVWWVEDRWNAPPQLGNVQDSRCLLSRWSYKYNQGKNFGCYAPLKLEKERQKKVNKYKNYNIYNKQWQNKMIIYEIQYKSLEKNVMSEYMNK